MALGQFFAIRLEIGSPFRIPVYYNPLGMLVPSLWRSRIKGWILPGLLTIGEIK